MADQPASEPKTKCGFVGIVGRPNVGKSTLLNHLLGQKVSITCRKPQTTRHTLVGNLTRENTQFLFVDTPGIHEDSKKALNRYMNDQAWHTFEQVDVILWLVDREHWTALETQILKRLQQMKVPVILLINKVDLLPKKEKLLPLLASLSNKMNFASVMPLSALKGHNRQALLDEIEKYLPAAAFCYDEDQLTDRSVNHLIAEIVREKIMRQLGEEVPYQATVMVERFEQAKTPDEKTTIDAAIFVERTSQKGMLIGKQGERLKSIGQQARLDIEALLDQPIRINLWVKTSSGWSDTANSLAQYGYD